MDTVLSLRRDQDLDHTTAEIMEVFVLVLIDPRHHHQTIKSTTDRTSTTKLRKTIIMSIARTNILTTTMTTMETMRRSDIVGIHLLITNETLCLAQRSSTIQLVAGTKHLSILTTTTTMSMLASMETKSWKEVMLPTNSLKRMRRGSSVKAKEATVLLLLLVLASRSDRHKMMPLEAGHLMTRDMRASNPTNSLTMVGEKGRKISSFSLTLGRLLLMDLATRSITTQETQAPTGREVDSLKASHPTTSTAEEAMGEEACLVPKTSSSHQSLKIQTTMISMEDRVQRILLTRKRVLVSNKAIHDKAPQDTALQDKVAFLDWGPFSLGPEDPTVGHQEEGIGSTVVSSVGEKEDHPYALDSEFNIIVFALVVVNH